MAKKRLVLALGHDALGTNLPEQKAAVAKAAKTIADFIQNGWQVATRVCHFLRHIEIKISLFCKVFLAFFTFL